MSTQAIVTVGTRQWTVQVATTPTELSQGLSNVVSIPAETGMLFDLGSVRTVTVNAFDMLFSLGILFISEGLVVNEVITELAPGQFVIPDIPCRYFLEVNEGELDDISPLDQVVITGYPPETTETSSIIGLMVTMMIVVMMMGMMSKVIKEVK